MFSASKRLQVVWLVGLAALALTAPPAFGQGRSMRMQQAMMVRQFQANSMMMGQNRSIFQPAQFGFNSNSRFGFNPNSQFGFNANSRFGNFSPFGSPLNSFANPYMSFYMNPFGAAGLGGGLYGASPALGQYSSLYGNPYLSAYSGLYGSGYGGSYGSGYGGSYGSGYGGSGDTSTQDSSEVTGQQALLIREKARAERVANRRKIFDEDLYEREKTPTAEQERQRSLQQQLNRSRNNPPVTDVLSGKALNDILADLRTLAARGLPADLDNLPSVLQEESLQNINVSTGADSIGLLKHEGRLTWPVALDGPEFQPERERLSAGALTAVNQATSTGQVDSGTIRQMTGDLDKLHKRLRGKVRDLSPSLYIEAKTFLNNFDRSARALGQPDVGNHFNGKYALRSTNVAELVKQMAEQGLHFAPAVRGDEAAYEAVYLALAAYDRAAQGRTVAR